MATRTAARATRHTGAATAEAPPRASEPRSAQARAWPSRQPRGGSRPRARCRGSAGRPRPRSRPRRRSSLVALLLVVRELFGDPSVLIAQLIHPVLNRPEPGGASVPAGAPSEKSWPLLSASGAHEPFSALSAGQSQNRALERLSAAETIRSAHISDSSSGWASTGAADVGGLLVVVEVVCRPNVSATVNRARQRVLAAALG
jgi:hypothetical protein